LLKEQEKSKLWGDIEEDYDEFDNFDKFLRIQKELLPSKTPSKIKEPSFEDIPEVSRRTGAKDNKSLLQSQHKLKKCFGLFK
jgi:hypothetical protein